MLDESPRVALLGRDDPVRAQLRSALAELGAILVYEGDLRGADASAVTGSQPEVVLLNLDAEGEDALDGIETLLLDPSMRVVFNEAETTATLSGWDLARWARHLAAKVLGHDRTIPPPPAGAEYLPDTDLIPSPGAPPSPVSLAEPLSMETLRTEASESFDGLPTGVTPTGWREDSASDADTDGSGEADTDTEQPELLVDSAAVASALSAQEAPMAEVLRTSPPELGDSTFDGHANVEVHDQTHFGIDFDDLDAALAAIDAGDDGAAEESSMAGQNTAPASELELELEALSRDTGGDENTANEDDESSPGSIDFDSASLSFSLDSEEIASGDELDADVAVLAAGLDAMEQSTSRAEMQVRDPDFFFDLGGTKGPSDAELMDDAPNRASSTSRAKSGISLELADELAEVQAGIPKAQPPAPTINIGHLSLEALPDPGLLVVPTKVKPVEETYLPRPGIDLMLAPLDAHLDEATTQPANRQHSAVEADLASDDDATAVAGRQPFDISSLSLEMTDAESDEGPIVTRIPRVLVLGASIGGPDALRTFLAVLPADFPALLVLAQHLESGFFDRLAQQLQKVSKLPVRVASADTPACAGEVVIIPSGERVRIRRDGRVRREPYVGPTHYRPCIDDVMRDIADAFGKNATAIIFSGMAGDAVEGAVYITSKGGEVWAQTPASCVVSSMVDGAQARGVVEFVGSPRELAEYCVARYGQTV